LEDSKEGESIRPIGLPVVEYLERRRTDDVGTYVFPGQGEDNAFGSFPNHWKQLLEDSSLSVPINGCIAFIASLNYDVLRGNAVSP
jgi:hypothetical protein